MRDTITTNRTIERRVWIGTDGEVVMKRGGYQSPIFVQEITEKMVETTISGATATTYVVKVVGPVQTSKGARHRSRDGRINWQGSSEDFVMNSVPEEIRQHLIGMDALRERVAR